MANPDHSFENLDEEGSGLWRGVDRVVDNLARSFGRDSNRREITRAVGGRVYATSESVRVVEEPPMSRTPSQLRSPPPVNHSTQAEEEPPRQPSAIRLNRSAHAASTGPLNPVADAFEDEDCFELTVELPGVSEADIDIEFADGAITLTAERRRAEGSNEKKHLVRERSYGTFKRRFALPFQANPDIIDAAYLDGVVTVRALRPPETKPRTKKIDLKRS
jgi:HSP20 family protein